MQVRRLINRSFLRGSHISLFLTLIGCSTLHRTLYNDRRNLHGNQRRRFIFMVEQLSRHLHLAHRPLLLPNLSPPCHCRSSPIWGATFSRWHSAYGSVDPWAYSQRELVTGWRLRAVVNLRRFRCSKCVRVETIHIFRLTRDIQPQKKILQFTDFVREKEFIIAALPDCDHLGPFIKRTVLGITHPPTSPRRCTSLGPGLRRALHECPPAETPHVHIYEHDITHRLPRQRRVITRHRTVPVRYCSGHRRATRI